MSKTRQFSKPHMPLTPPIFYILLVLRIQPRHGYEIMKQVRELSNGKIQLGPGTLYGAVKRLSEEKLILETEKNIKAHHERRRYYALTEKGTYILGTELERYSEALHIAKKFNVLSPIALSL